MGFLTTMAGLPYLIALLVILIEFIGSLFLILGLATRIASFAIIINFIGVVLTSHIQNGFFMNWGMKANQGEGIEFFILLFGLALISLIAGGGMASLDTFIARSTAGSSSGFNSKADA